MASDSFLLNTIADATSSTKNVSLDLSLPTLSQLAGALEVRLQSTSTSGISSQTTFDHLLVSAEVNAQLVPDPSTWTLAALGLLGLGILAFRRRRSSV